MKLRWLFNHLLVVVPMLAIMLLVLYAAIALNYPTTVPSNAINWSVAMGTTLLALFTFVATLESRRQTRIDRKIRFIESQLDGLHSHIIEQETNFMKGVLPAVEAFELIKKKRYLAGAELRLKISELLTKFDGFWDAYWKYEKVKDLPGGPPEEEEIKRGLNVKSEESRARLITCGRELVSLAMKDYDALHDELQKLSGEE